jgi:DNA repair exonuclease SbcCD ATPase subunit
MDTTRARADLEAAKQESGARAAEAARLQGMRSAAEQNAKGLQDAVQKAQAEAKRLGADADRAKELADQAAVLVAARERMLQEAVDKAQAALVPANEVDEATKAAEWADHELQKQREKVKLGEQIADLESKKAKAEQAAKDAEANAQKARAGAADAAAAVTAVLRQIDEKKDKLKALETPPAPPTPPAGGASPTP